MQWSQLSPQVLCFPLVGRASPSSGSCRAAPSQAAPTFPFSSGSAARCGGPWLGCQTGNTLDPGRQTLNSQLLEKLPPRWPALTQTSWRHCNARKCYSWAAWQIGSTHADLGTAFGGPRSAHCPGTEPLITVYIRQSDTFQLLNDLLFPPLFSPYRTLCVYTAPRCSTSASCLEPYLMHRYQPQLRRPQGAQITAALLPPPLPQPDFCLFLCWIVWLI